MNFLQNIHQISHRDLKPGNILLSRKNVPMIADFGISKIVKENDLKEKSYLTSAGTEVYFSPEKFDILFKKKSRIINEEKNDVFALGVICMKLFLGKEIESLNTDEIILNKKLDEIEKFYG